MLLLTLIPALTFTYIVNMSGNLIIQVSWTRPSQTGLGPGNAYQMIAYEMMVDSSCNDDRLLAFPETQTSVTLSDVVEGCKYVFRVRGLNDAGYGQYQNSSEVRGLSLPTAVRNLDARARRALQVDLTWDVPTNTGDGTITVDNLISYVVEVVLGPIATADFSFPLRRYSLQNTSLALAVPTLEVGVLHCFRVRAQNLAGLGAHQSTCSTPLIPPLLEASVLPSSTLTGANIFLDVVFRLSTELNAGDQIVITFPADFVLQEAALLSGGIGEVTVSGSVGSRLCGYRCSPSINDVFISRQGTGEVLSAGTMVRITLHGIVNRGWEGPSGAFQIRTVDQRGNYTKDQNLTVTGYDFSAGIFSDPVANLDATNTGDITNLRLSFRSARNPVPPSARLEVTVGAEMIPTGVTAMTISVGGVDETLELSVQGSTISGTRSAATGIPKTSNLIVTIVGMRNRITQGHSGLFVLKMLTGLGALIDSSSEFGSILIAAGSLLEGQVNPDSCRARELTRYVLSFKLGSVGLPPRSRIDIAFPDTIEVQGAIFDDDDTAKQGLVGSVSLSVQGQKVSLVRTNGAALAPGTSMVLPVQSIRNAFVGMFGNMTIRTVSEVNGIVMEEIANLTSKDFEPPRVTNLKTRNIQTLAGLSLTIFGSNLGLNDFTSTTSLGMSTCASTIWISQSAIVGKVSRGIGQTYRVSISVDNIVESAVGFVSYDSASLHSMVNPRSVSARGEAHMRGNGLGSTSYTNDARLGNSGCEQTEWVSDSIVKCIAAGGVRGTLSAVVTASGYIGTLSETFSYLCIPFVQTHVRSNLPSVGRVTLELDSRAILNGDYTARVKIGETSSTNTRWISDSAVICTVPAGRDDQVTMVMTAGLQTGTVSQVLTYDLTQLAEALDEHERALNMPTSGNYALTMRGLDFGTFSTSPRMRFGATAAESSAWASDSSVTARVAAGCSASHSAIISVFLAKNHGEISGVASYDAPQILVVEHASVESSNDETNVYFFRENSPLRTVKSVQFQGHHLGYHDYTLAMRVGNTECQRSLWFSVSSLACRVPAGSKASHGIVATIATQYATKSGVISYDSPAARVNSSIGNLPAFDREPILLRGSNFDGTSRSLNARSGVTTCETTTWMSESSIVCKAVQGVRSSLHMVVTAGQLVGSVSQALSHDLALWKEYVKYANRPSLSPGVFIEFLPSGLERGYSPDTRLGRTASQTTYWQTQTHMVCKTAAGVGMKLSVVLTSGVQASSVTNSFTFDAATIFYPPRVNAPTAGLNELTWSGQSFGAGLNSIRARLGSSQCSSTGWLSDSSIACKDMSGFSGWPQALILSMGSTRVSTSTNMFSYDGPKVGDLSAGTDSAPVVLMSGTNFGTNDLTLSAVISTAGCAATSWMSDTSLVCTLNKGYVFRDIPLSEADKVRVCRKCKPQEVLVECTESNAGYCTLCEPCDPGFFRFDCKSGTDSPGECLPCKADGPIGQRQFKAIVGDASTQCAFCTICGGRNQDGTSYEKEKCTPKSDTKCQPCAACDRGVRIGCQGANPGRCVSLGTVVDPIFATITQGLLLRQVEPTGYRDFVAIADNYISLTGDFSGTAVTIVNGTKITFPYDMNDIYPYVIVVASDLTLEMRLAADTYFGPDTRGLRLVSNVTYYDVSGTEFDPPAKLHILCNDTKDDSVSSMFRWNASSRTWTNMSTTFSTTSNDKVLLSTAPTEHFSAYAVFASDNAVPACCRTMPTCSPLCPKTVPGTTNRNYVEIIVPIVVVVSVFFCAMAAMYWLKCRNFEKREDTLPANEWSSRVEATEPKSFFLMTEQGPVELEVAKPAAYPVKSPGEKSEPGATLLLQLTPPRKLTPVQPGPVQPSLSTGRIQYHREPMTPSRSRPRADSRVEDSILASPYTGFGVADESRASNQPPLSVTRRPSRVADVRNFPFPSDENPSHFRPSVPPRDSSDVFPSTDLAMLARGFATPAKVSAEASRARSQDRVSLSSPPQTFRIPVRSPDLENSLSMLAMGFTTPLRASASADTSREAKTWPDTEIPAMPENQRAWRPDPSSGRRLESSRPANLSSDTDPVDDDVFGYENERGSNVDDVILSVGRDFLPQAPGGNSVRQSPIYPAQQRDDTPEHFAANLQDEYDNAYDNEAEFSIQPGARRFFPARGGGGR